MKLILLLFVAVTANAATLGSRKCSHGPAYWCGTINQAKECGAVQYCLDNHWPNIKTAESSFCTDCKAGIDLLREELSKASTENEIVQYVEKFCKDLGTLAEDCKLVIDAYGPEVLKSLIQELKPEQVCALMGFCKGETAVTAQEKDHSAEILALVLSKSSTKIMKMLLSQVPSNGDQCGDCTNFFGDVKNLLNNATVEQMITNEIEMVCNYLGQYKEECKLLISTLVPQGIGQLVQRINPKEICSEIGFCKSSLLRTEDPVPEPPANDGCSDCKAFMGDVKTLLSNATVQKMILQDLESICNSLGDFAPQCQEYVSQYGPLVFGVALQYFDPNIICHYLGFCQAEDFPKQLPFPSNDMCSDCTTIVKDVTTFLKDPNVQKAIVHQLEDICDDIGSLGPQCKKYVDQYVPLVLNLALEYLTPNTVCSALGLCLVEEEPEAVPEPGDICTDCENFVRDFDAVLNNYTVQEKLLKDLLVLCKYIPNYQSECEQYLPQYGGLVFEVIAGLLNPKTICKDVRLCQGQTSPIAEDADPTTPAPATTCSECEAIFKDIQALLTDPNFQNMIVADIESLCSSLGALEPICKKYVEQYGKLVINALANYIMPESFCSAVGLCSGEFPEWLLKIQMPQVGGDLCTDCKALVNDADGLLKNATVQKMFLTDLTVICKYFGGLSGECKNLILEYGPLVFDYLASVIDPATICDDIGLCPSLVNLGADQCTDCTMFFQDVSTILNTPSVQQMILQQIENLCNDVSILGPQCQQYVSEYGPVIYNLVLQYLNPSMICKGIRFCSGTCQPSPKLFSLNADQCTDCKNFFQDVSTVLNNPATQQTILQDIENLCNDLGSLGPQCQQYISEYGPLVINFLLQYLDPSAICGDIGFCTAVSRPPMKLVSVNADQCTDCKTFFQDVSTILNNATIQQMILQDIESLCNDLGSLGPQCQQYISEYGPLVINFLLQYVDPSAICSDIGFCSSISSPPPVTADQCTDCKNYMQDVVTLLSNATVQQMILQDIENLCNDLGSLGPQCQQYVSQYGPLVFNFLLQYLDPSTICSYIGFCPAVSRPPMNLVSVNADQCTDCKNFFQDVSTYLNNPAIQQMILQDIETLCNDLGSLGPQCQQYVSEYGPLVINFLLQYLDPNAICGDIGFCSAVSRPPTKLFGVNADQCTDCKNFFTDVSKILNDPSTQQMILQDIENLCNDLGSLGPQCQQYVSEYGPLVINFLLQYLDPNAICGDIGFCSVVSRPPTKLFGVNADQCTDCKNFFTDVSKILNDPNTQQMILQDIENLCNDLGSLGPQCQQYVSEYGPLVINFLLQYLDPTAICGDIGFCSAVSRPPAKLFGVNADQCTDCKNFFTDVSKILNDPSTQQMILQDIENLCNDLGPSIGPQCQQYVSEYGPLVINFLLQYLDPSAICGDIGFCSAVSRPPTKLFGVNADQCTDCKNFFQDVSTILNNPSTQQMILQDIENLCNDLGSLGPQCQQYVSEYGPLVINFLLQYLDPTSICGDIGFCTSLTTIPAMELVAAHPISTLDQELPAAGPVACRVCKIVVQKVELMLKDKATEAEITAALAKVCSLLPSSLSAQCQSFINQYGPVLIQLLANQMDPQQVCSLIRLCGKGQELVQYQVSQLCTICEFAMAELDKLIEQPASITDIEAALDELCSHLPPTVRESCQSFVDTYTEAIVQAIVRGISPKLVCRAIGVCFTQQQPTCAVQKYEFGPTCMICKYVVRWLEEMMTRNSTMTQIEKGLEEVCSVMPQQIRSKCLTFVDTYVPQLINLISTYARPGLVCRLMQMCILEEAPMPEPQVEANEFCVVCEFAMSELDKLLTQPFVEDKIEKALDQVCSLLPATVSETCKSFVSQYTREIVFLIAQSVSPKQVCTALTLCTGETEAEEVNEEKSLPPITEDDFEATTECIVCEFAFRELEKELQKNATEEEIKMALQEVCSLLPSSLADDCNILISYYTTEVIYQLLRKYPANKICTLLKVCAEGDGELTAVSHLDVIELTAECAICEFVARELETLIQKNSTEASIRKALDSVCERLPSTVAKDCEMFVNYYTEEIIFILVSQFPPDKICSSIQLCTAADVRVLVAEPETAVKTVGIEASPKCLVCEMVARELEGMLQKNSTQAEIKKALDSVCSRLPSTVAKNCQSFVDYYTQEIIFILVSQFPPDKLCTTLTLCTTPQMTLAKVEVKEPEASSVTCEVCQYAMQYLESMLSDNATEAEIEAALEKVCSLIPSAYRAECDYFVQEYTAEIVKLILSKVTPSEVCSALGLCSSIQESETSSVTCEVCEYAMKYLESVLSDNATEAEIEAALEKVCSLVPSAYREECDYFVQEYTAEIVKLILSEVSPSEVCSALGLCSSVQDNPSISCEVCIIAVRTAELYITKNSTEQEIDKLLEKLCMEFPGTLQEQCVSFVQSFGNALPELLVTFVNPEKVCTLLEVCPRGEDSKYSLFERCKTGPEFWCATQANADLCNAVEHCKRHVWN